MMALTAHMTASFFFSNTLFKQTTLAASTLLATQSGIYENGEDCCSHLKHANTNKLQKEVALVAFTFRAATVLHKKVSVYRLSTAVLSPAPFWR